MAAENIFIESIPELNITELEVMKKVNSHFTAKVKGYLVRNKKQEQDYIKEDNINILLSAGDEPDRYSVFRGIITNITITSDHDFYELVITAESFTRLLDMKENFRVFQDLSISCKQIAEKIVEDQENAVAIYAKSTKGITRDLLVQYQETDWGFLKRIASAAGEPLIADCTNEKPSVFFGIPEREKVKSVTCDSVSRRLIMEGDKKIQEILIFSKDLLKLIDKVNIMGIPMNVFETRMWLENGEIMNQYRLRQIKDFSVPEHYNHNLAGISVMGQVRAVRNTQVQITLDDDIVNSKINRRWFDFSTVYSSSDETGWYCMPEIGDKIRLYFPDEKEEHAYVVSAVHSQDNQKLRTMPEEKFIRTVHDKEVRFTPSKIVLTNHKGMKIVLDDEYGITVISNKNVEIRANGSIYMESQDGIEIEADTGVFIRQGGNMLMVRDGILEQGLNIEHR